MYKIAVLIPCYNEEQTVARVIKSYAKAIPEAKIYVYDNNSKDKTAEKAQKAGAIVVYEPKQGKANVVRSMFRDIDADCYVMVDGDDTYPADNVPEMIQLVKEKRYDMIVGDRLSSTYYTENKRPFHNVGNMLVKLMVNKIFHGNITDIMSGQRVFSRQFVKSFPVLSKGFEIETEMSIHALYHNFGIASVPVMYKDRPEGSVSKLNTYRDGFKVIMTIIKLWKDYKPLFFFGMISAFCFLLSLLLFVPALVDYYQIGQVPRFPRLIVSMAFAMIGIQLFTSGLILDTTNRKAKESFELQVNTLCDKKGD